jgi:hypothetical protein
MFLTKKHLSRRTFLRGAGVAVGLPFLDAMVPAWTVLAQTAASPKPRMGFMYLPHGAIMEQHRAKPSCNACHGVMDPLGFALENFDAIGEWRAQDRWAGTPIDASSQLVDGTTISGPVDLRKVLLKRSQQFVQTMTEKLMTYAMGRSVEYYDMPVVRQIVRDAARDNYRFSSLVMGVVKSAPFQMRKVPNADEPTSTTAP